MRAISIVSLSGGKPGETELSPRGKFVSLPGLWVIQILELHVGEGDHGGDHGRYAEHDPGKNILAVDHGRRFFALHVDRFPVGASDSNLIVHGMSPYLGCPKEETRTPGGETISSRWGGWW